MAKNRFAQPLYGKIIYIYETNLTMEQLPTIFDPSTYWIDVTGLDCEVGYLVSFKEGVGLVLAPPPNEEYTFEELKAQKLELVDAWTADKITGGFISQCTGNPVRHDSDKDTQLTMQGIALNVSTERFANEYPLGCPVRGYKEGETEKTIQYLNAAQVYTWCADLSSHIGACKQQGWIKQAQVEAALSKEDLDAIILD
ncbi:hypothetical protein [Phascolarctobacterium faecium]|uniref:DUF4376 domain-containing protein n=1 Tax=Phascolarctobacterium faecium TaxID=33025 RepID=UPI003AB2F2FD